MSYRNLFYFLNFAMLVVFGYSFYKDYTPEWKHYQRTYYDMAADKLDQAGKHEEAVKMRETPLEIKQIINKDLDRYDRCTTCHVGMDQYVNPEMKNDFTQNPYKAHPNVGVYDKYHNFQKFGCTICHQGQGLATTADGAHGKVRNWEEPLLRGTMVQASCVRCHQNFEKLKGAEVAAKGKQLFYEHGCQGCHSVKGVGGIISVDLGNIADKPLERIAGYNFSRVMKDGKPLPEIEWNIQNWIYGHLTNDPIVVTPNDPHKNFNAEPIAPSGMPNWMENDAAGKREITEQDAWAITTWLMSMRDEPVPSTYLVTAAPAPEPKFSDPVRHGKFVFEKYGCAGCHGLHGTKGRRNYNALGPGEVDKNTDMDKGREPTLVDVVGTFTHDELVKKISNGVPSTAINKFNPDGPTPPLYMPSWKDKISPAELNDLATYLLSIAKKQDVGF